MLRRFWEGAVRGGYVGHRGPGTRGEEIWSAKGGRLVGTSHARIGFLADVVAASPSGVLEPLASDFDVPWAGVEDQYLVSYHGSAARGNATSSCLPDDGTSRSSTPGTAPSAGFFRGAPDIRPGPAARETVRGGAADRRRPHRRTRQRTRRMWATGVRRRSITPGQLWLDTNGNRIHAHGGSLLQVDGTFYWYGENKERSTPAAALALGRALLLLQRPLQLDGRGPHHPARRRRRRPRRSTRRWPWTGRTSSTTRDREVRVLDQGDVAAGQRSTVLVADESSGPTAASARTSGRSA